ncbi:hypothetical protein QBC38DRAFT_258345 [Podospora fimiseda]|uniref:Uncharacterized protein n=1 Tax=Podospora fimiseda TaxID=252190 RepID=A0AAN7BWX0_9PEZI|nr:hypothetical protein QBC38DRAFT_258345 [Podospora fimiseda]
MPASTTPTVRICKPPKLQLSCVNPPPPPPNQNNPPSFHTITSEQEFWQAMSQLSPWLPQLTSNPGAPLPEILRNRLVELSQEFGLLSPQVNQAEKMLDWLEKNWKVDEGISLTHEKAHNFSAREDLHQIDKECNKILKKQLEASRDIFAPGKVSGGTGNQRRRGGHSRSSSEKTLVEGGLKSVITGDVVIDESIYEEAYLRFLR